SRQLLVQSGFQFPWDDDVLVFAAKVFQSAEFESASSVHIGRTEKHVAIQIGTWTVHLAIEDKRRFPETNHVIPNKNSARTHCRWHPADQEFLKTALRRLPAQSEFNSPVTVEG